MTLYSIQQITYKGKTCTFDVTVTVAPVSVFPSVTISNNPGTKTINYGDGVTLTANTANLPDDAQIKWYVNDAYAATGESFTHSDAKADATITVKIVDAADKVLTDENGDECSDTQTIKVNAGFFQKLISFFKNLFRLNRVTVQAIIKP